MVATTKAYFILSNMKKDIDTRYNQCAVCAIEQKERDLSTPLEPTLIFKRTMDSICTDWCKMGARKFLIWADRYSGYVGAREFRNMTMDNKVSHLEYIITDHGRLLKITSDKIPSYRLAFEEFCKNKTPITRYHKHTFPPDNWTTQKP